MTNYDPLRAKARFAVLATFGSFMGLALAGVVGWTTIESPSMPVIDETPAVAAASVQPAVDLSDAFTNLADAVTPSVVRIEALRRNEQPDLPERWLRQFGGPTDPQGLPEVSLSVGSGFIVSPDGYILTNTHVVDDARDVTVQFADKRSLPARVIGVDPFTDVAVVKVEPDAPLPSMSLGDSDDVRVGEWVLAVGNPGVGRTPQLDFTVTAGIISARGRPLQLLQQDLSNDPRFGDNASRFQASRWAIEDFLQTDAVINPGNSGGPMINLKGQAIGINTAILSTTGAFQGYGFAVPINIARSVMEDIVEFGTVRRPRIGVEIQTVTANDADVYGLPSVAGVLIQAVDPTGPSASVLQPEDVIVALNGEEMGYSGELQGAMAEYGPGDVVALTVYRAGAPVDVRVKLDEAPFNEVPEVVDEIEIHGVERLGIRVAYLSEAEARGGNYPSGGVYLAGVDRGSEAARSGVGRYAGAKLVQVGDREIGTERDLSDALAAVGRGEAVTLRFQISTDGQTRVVNVRMPG
ncbi:MAG: trypsin-like peptidase domain-containing protein [Gemmatimonadetes bacterium]|nr:trypsin-like peptidase domain-containing protein [Gemmatimonadota bacterium]